MLKSKAQRDRVAPVIRANSTIAPSPDNHRLSCTGRRKNSRSPSCLIFRSEGAQCTIATPEQHDRMMAVVQGLTHFVTLCMADSVRRLGIDIETTRAFTSPVYQIELSLVGRLLSQDPSLYADILQQNPFVPGGAVDMHVISRRSPQDCGFRGSCTVPGIFPSKHPASRCLL